MVGGALWRKLGRELWQARWQYGTVALMVHLGVVFYAGVRTVYQTLTLSLDASYTQYRLEHFGITLRSAPASIVQRIRRVEGVAGVEGRLVEPVIIELGTERPRRLAGLLVGIETRRLLEVNRLRLITGRPLRGEASREVLLESKFAAYHNLHPRERIRIRWRAQEEILQVVGTVRSPEYIYVLQSKRQVLPSEDVFGVLFAPRELVAQLTDQGGQINEVRVFVAGGYDPELVAREVQRLLTAYDPEPTVWRKDQPSYYVVRSAVEELQAYAVFFPTLFLSVSILILYTQLMRLVMQQRSVIGLLRALGYTRIQVLLHYLGGALVAWLVGGLTAIPATYLTSYWMVQAYLSFLQPPVLQYAFPWGHVAGGLLLALGATLISGAVPGWVASQVPPAQALRGEVPTVGRVTALDKFIPVLNRARLLYRLPVRNLSRSPRRTIVGTLGVGLGVMMAMLARGIMDSRDEVIARYFEQVLSEDVRVGFTQPQSARIVHQVRQWRGVQRVEGVLELPVKLRRGERTYDALLRAVDPDQTPLRLFDESGSPVTPTGLVCGQVVRDRLRLERGDMVYLSLPAEWLDEPPREMPMRVHGLVWETVGTVVYMPRVQALRWLRRQILAPPDAITSLRVWVRSEYTAEVVQRLRQLPNTGAVVARAEILQRFKRLDAIARQFFYFMMGFGMVIALGVIFSVVTVGVLERRSEVATLLTIGFQRKQVYGLLLSEHMLVVTLGVLLGLVLGRVMVSVATQVLVPAEQAELIAFRPYITWQTYAFTAMLGWLVGLLAQVPALRAVARVDLVASLKERIR